MFSNEEWDPVYLNQFLDKKLADMEKAYIKYGNSIHHYSEVRLIRLARKYLDLSWNNDRVTELLLDRMEQKYGKSQFEIIEKKKGFNIMRKLWGGKENKKLDETVEYIYVKRAEIEEKYHNKFWDIMKKHIGRMAD
jgi:hypothetical protein